MLRRYKCGTTENIYVHGCVVSLHLCRLVQASPLCGSSCRSGVCGTVSSHHAVHYQQQHPHSQITQLGRSSRKKQRSLSLNSCHSRLPTCCTTLNDCVLSHIGCHQDSSPCTGSSSRLNIVRKLSLDALLVRASLNVLLQVSGVRGCLHLCVCGCNRRHRVLSGVEICRFVCRGRLAGMHAVA